MKQAAISLFLALLVTLPAVADSARDSQKSKPISEQSRIWILRGLMAEVATARLPMPSGADGLPLQSTGAIDEKELKQRLTDHGTAVKPGEVVKITAVNFEKNKIVFEINGGGKSKRRWLDGIQVGMGGNTHPVSNPDQTPVKGSSIELLFNGRVPDITVDDVKLMLAPALDFSRRSATVVYTETLPKPIQEAIKDHKATVGMDRDMVLAALGRPERKMRETNKDGVETEDWIYGEVPRKVTIVTFIDDKVARVRELTPGVPETNVPRAENTGAVKK